MSAPRWLPGVLLASLACQPGPLDGHWVEIETRDAAAGEAVWRDAAGERRVWLVREPAAAPWTRIDVRAGRDAPSVARLLVGPPAAVLLQHAASRQRAFQPHLLPSRLAALRDASAPPRLALVLDASAVASARGSTPLVELEPESLAPVLAAAEALGAWDVLAGGELPSRGKGRPFLPRFVPRAPGAWSDLRGTALEASLPGAVAARMAGDPALRAESYARLAELAAALPELSERLDALSAALPDGVPRDDVGALRELLLASAEAYASYLDSVWVEQLVTQRSAEALEIELYVHALVPVRLEGFAAAAPRRIALLQKNAIGALRLRDPETDGVRVALAQRERVLLPVGRQLQPVAVGPERFRSTRLAYRVEGLAGSDPLRAHLHEALRPILSRADGRPIDPSHVRHLAAIADPRFGAEAEEDAAVFARRLPSRLRGGAAVLGAETLILPAGRYELVDDLLLPAGLGLRIEAGAELRIHAGRSLLVRGPLSIEGSAERPVRVRPASDAPWGVLAVQGADAGADAVTRIRHLELEGGSEDEIRGAYYSGQLSVYHQDLLLEHSTLRASHADDSLNAKSGRVEIRDVAILDSAADAADLDWVEGRLTRVRFEGMGPGGDGLDLSGSRVLVEDSVFALAGDKCISVGEKADVAVRGSLLRGCSLGLASKDLSTTEVRDSLFLDNGRDLAAYRKKPVFGGGTIRGERLILARGREGALHDELSQIAVRGAVLVGGDDGDIELSDAARLEADADARGVLAPLAGAGSFSAADFARAWSALR